jgi:outer membrane biosynthesis protein TonB
MTSTPVASAKHYRRYLPIAVGAGLIVIVAIAVVLLIKNFLADSDEPKKHKVQQISLIKPPEPPPPPPKPPEEKPPEPKEVIKQEVPKLAQPIKADSQPPGPTGPSAANGDPGFGIGVGGSGSGSRYGYFVGLLQKGIIEQFNRNEKLRKREYKLGVGVWIEKDGTFSKIELLDSTGDPDLDAQLKKELIKFKFDDLPDDYPKHIKLSINSH